MIYPKKIKKHHGLENAATTRFKKDVEKACRI